MSTHITALVGLLEEMAVPQQAPQQAAGTEPPVDSIEGSILSLLHALVDGITRSTPKTMQTSSSVNRSTRPVQIQLRGRNSQGLFSVMTVRVDLIQTPQGIQGIQADVRLVLANQQGQPVAQQAQRFVVRRTDSVKQIVQKYGEWLGGVEALRVAPVANNGTPVML